jgi:TetR/AcrR family transcriptional regulator, cholesterol catabolism regulator
LASSTVASGIVQAAAATAPARPRRARYEQRRREVVNTAARLFAEQGYHDTSIDDLVEATGLQRGGLYHYIDSKQHLLLLTHEELIGPLLDEAEPIVASELPAPAKLRELLRAWVTHVAAHRDHMVVFNEARRLIESDPAWEEVRAARERFRALLEGVLVEGREEGQFVIDDVRLLELSILGIVNYTPQWLDPEGRVPPEKIAESYADLLLRGLLPR